MHFKKVFRGKAIITTKASAFTFTPLLQKHLWWNQFDFQFRTISAFLKEISALQSATHLSTLLVGWPGCQWSKLLLSNFRFGFVIRFGILNRRKLVDYWKSGHPNFTFITVRVTGVFMFQCFLDQFIISFSFQIWKIRQNVKDKFWLLTPRSP